MWIVYTPVLLVAFYVIYQRFFHPLSNVPGPFLASITPFWLAWHAYHGRRPRLDLELFKQYGGVVRITPDEVMAANPKHFKTIYGAGTKFTRKGRFYEATTDRHQPPSWDYLNMLVENDVEKLRVQRRLAGPIYSTANAKKHESLLDNNLSRWIARLRGLTAQPLDIYYDLELLSVDVLTEITFAAPFGAVEAGSDGHHMANMAKSWRWWGWIGYLPWLNYLDKTYMTWGARFAPSAASVFPVFYFCLQKLAEYVKSSEAGETCEPCIYDDMRSLTRDRPEFRPNWATRLALTNLGAGVDTTSWTVATILVGISQNPSVSARLRAELDTAVQQGKISKNQPVPGEAGVPPGLHARLWPNIAPSLPRIVPGGGVDVDGYYIPAGFTIGMSPKQHGLAEEIFGAAPDTFRPERWLEAESTQRHDMELRNFAFGGPSRRCPGMHLAWVIMAKVVASVYLNFDIKIVNELDGKPGPGGSVWTEFGSFPTKWDGLEVELTPR